MSPRPNIRTTLAAALLAVAPVQTRADEPKWSMVPAPGFPTCVSAYDPSNDRVLFLGIPETNLPELWSLSLTEPRRWTQVQTIGPYPTEIRGLIARPRHGDLLMVGPGFEMWTLTMDGGTWTRLPTPTGSSPNLLDGTLCYDDANDRFVHYGGYYECLEAIRNDVNKRRRCYTNDVWILSLDPEPNWTHLDPSASSQPIPRGSPLFLHDPTRDRILVVGGADEFNTYSDGWELRLTPNVEWAPLDAQGEGPDPGAMIRYFHDANSNRFVAMDSGRELWSLSLDEPLTWSKLVSPQVASRTEAIAIDFDSARDDLVSLDGDGVAWSTPLGTSPAWVKGSTALASCARSAGAYSEKDRSVILFGGIETSGASSTTRIRELDEDGSWSVLSTAGDSPSARYGHTAVMDEVGRRLIVFGGTSGTETFNDVWQLHLDPEPTWSLLPTSGLALVPRFSHAAFFDSRRSRMFVFGGESPSGTASEVFGDVWMLDLGGTPTWTKLEPGPYSWLGLPPDPGKRRGATTVYDSNRDRMLLFGGRGPANETTYYTWGLQLGTEPQWELLSTLGSPGIRAFHAAVFDPKSDDMLLFGADATTLGGAWRLDFSMAPPEWGRVGPPIGSGAPRDRQSPIVAYDRGRLVVLGGTLTGTSQLAPRDWSLAITPDAATPVLVSLVGATIEQGIARVEWQLSGSSDVAEVYRSTGGDWNRVAFLSPDGEGRVVYRDSDIESGVRYGYRLEIAAESGRATFGEVWLDPTAAGFRSPPRAMTNPAGAEVLVAFALESESAVDLELLDATGRRRSSTRLDRAAAGAHVVNLGSSRVLEPGIYFIRLVRAGTIATAKVCVVR
jgi:Galactose oxidase, central domain/Kelch motif